MEARPVVLVFAAVAALAAMPARGAAGDALPFPVEKRTLANGLDVFAAKYDSPGIVSYQAVIRAGSRNEVEAGSTGTAHLVEHLVSRGATGQGDYDRVMRRLGADFNAFTADDWTCYHATLAADGLERLMQAESARLRSLAVDETGFRREAAAVLGEYRQGASDPLFSAREMLRGQAFVGHPYAHAAMGLLADIQDMPNQYERAREFFRRHYRPDNCALVVVGDIEPARVFALAERYFGDWARGAEPTPAPADARPPGRREARRDDWPAPVLPVLLAAWRTPAFAADDIGFASLDLAAALLFAEASPLYQQLVVERKLAESLSYEIEPHRDPYLVLVQLRARDADAVPALREALGAAIERLAAEGVDPAALDAARAHRRGVLAHRLATSEGAANLLSFFVNVAGDAEALNAYQHTLDDVTPEHVQLAAQLWLTPDQLTEVVVAGSGP
ncbi:MAG: insulinase family protein [Acidobacteria bacterium]|nr:insulinase family protein [Acidobacteriota bacterium]